MRIFFTLILIGISVSLYGQKSILATRLEKPPLIDGRFDRELWSRADSATDFIQMEPKTGEAATERTVVWIGYYENNLYAFFRCYQSTPVIARNQSRDALSKNDDIILLLLDTYDDDRSGYGLFVNPLGTQIDIKVNDDGRNIDINWDTEWECDAAIYQWGWTAEISIPFKSLKFKKSRNIWGVNFGRVIKSNMETASWSGPLTSDFRISQAGVLNGMHPPGMKMNFSLFPYVSLFKTSNNKIKADAGTDVELKINTNVTFNGTYNPDFATVEADEVKINLTRYELSYPEKRLFFQEGNEMYNTRIQTFYSRRIQDINYGVRINGKIGNYQFNALNVMSPELSAEVPASFFTVGRVKKDILKSSTVGLTIVDKSWKGGYTRSMGLDYTLNLGKTWKLTGQFVGSAPGNFMKSSAWFMRFARENNIYHYHFRYNSIGENFRNNVNQTGFIRDDDKREIDFEGTYKFWFEDKAIKYIDLGSNNNIFWSRETGILRSWALDNWANFYFSNRLSFKYKYNNEYKLFEKDFYNYQHQFTLGYNTEEWSHASLTFTTGKNFDDLFYLIDAGGRIKPFQNFSLSYTAQLIRFDPDPDSRSTLNNILTANYNFTKDIWIKAFAQTSRADERVYIYGLFGWRFKPPFGAVYLIYSHDQFLTDGNTAVLDNVFLKITYPLFN